MPKVEVWKPGRGTNFGLKLGEGQGDKNNDTVTIQTWTTTAGLQAGKTYGLKVGGVSYAGTAQVPPPHGVAHFTNVE